LATGEAANPVLVGVAQRTVRIEDPRAAPTPLDLLEGVCREAARDSGAGERLLGEVDTIGFVDSIGWSPHNGPRLLGERLGVRPRRELVTAIGGEGPLALLNLLAREIAAGRSRAALLAGAHSLRTLASAIRRGFQLDWNRGGAGEPERLETSRTGHSALEARYGLDSPRNVYPVFENALRARRGLDLAGHREAMGRLMSRFSEVAARNPHAWFRGARGAGELVEVTADNRMIAFPYPKRLNAVMETDQAAAVLLLSAGAARGLGIPGARQVHWWGGGYAVEEPWFFSERAALSRSPALAASARGALVEAGVALEEIGHFDLYSCFPVAVEMACDELGLAEDDPRGFTVTGGLPYAGGPGNNYCTHALAAMVERLRAEPSRPALLTGNGWYFTKHAASVLGGTPRRRSGTPEPPTAPGKPVVLAEEADGVGRIEGYTVIYDREGPWRGIVVGRLEDERRFLANTPADRSALEAFVAREQVGCPGHVAHRDGRNCFEPD
jgi:acetyl-CoA C-acetyltransferase